MHVHDSTKLDVLMEARLKNRQGGKVKVRRDQRVSRASTKYYLRLGKHISSLHSASSGGR